MADFGWKNIHEKKPTNKLKRKIENILSSAIRHLQTSVLLIIHPRGQFLFADNRLISVRFVFTYLQKIGKQNLAKSKFLLSLTKSTNLH